MNASDSRSEFSQKISRDISHGEAGQILSQVESALDKVTGPMEEVKLSSFTGRLLGILTRTVKYVTDVSILKRCFYRFSLDYYILDIYFYLQILIYVLV